MSHPASTQAAAGARASEYSERFRAPPSVVASLQRFYAERIAPMKTRSLPSALGAKFRRPFARVSQRVRLLTVFGVAVVIAALAFGQHARAAGTLYVNPDGVCGGNSPCFTTIQAAINAAS